MKATDNTSLQHFHHIYMLSCSTPGGMRYHAPRYNPYDDVSYLSELTDTDVAIDQKENSIM